MRAEPEETPGERVRRVREGLRLSMLRFALRLGVSRTHVVNVEAGREAPSFQLLSKIADQFPDVNLRYLLAGWGEPDENPPDDRGRLELLSSRPEVVWQIKEPDWFNVTNPHGATYPTSEYQRVPVRKNRINGWYRFGEFHAPHNELLLLAYADYGLRDKRSKGRPLVTAGYVNDFGYFVVLEAAELVPDYTPPIAFMLLCDVGPLPRAYLDEHLREHQR